jgi:hypothetical protein
MSCGLAVAAALFLADPALAAAPAAPVVAGAPPSVAEEPLYRDIVGRSRALKAMVDDWIASHAADAEGFAATTDFAAFRTRAEALAALDMQGHVDLRERGVDGDLKCILRGIAEDMPRRLAAVEEAPSPAERAVALSELAYLLNDNVEVITAPPQPAA